MGTAVLFSVRPEWCQRIATGEKTIEVRKSAPKLPTPYKGYLYCTRGHRTLYRSKADGAMRLYRKRSASFSHHIVLNGKVWAEFICDSTNRHDLPYPAYQCEVDQTLLEKSCLTYTELHNYVGSGNRFYGLHISALKIYDKPRELSGFRRVCGGEGLLCDDCAMYSVRTETCGNAALYLQRPPMSWCYVEEVLTDG